MRKTILLLLMFLVPMAFAQQSGSGGVMGGGGGPVTPQTYTYEECNEILGGSIEEYENAVKDYEGVRERANSMFRVLLTILISIFVVSVVYVLVSLGMEIQQIKDKGWKEWWKSKWGKKK